MPKVLKLFNTFTRTLNSVELSGKTLTTNGYCGPNNGLQPTQGSFYICGPTVYSDSHVGHAITYIRADLFRRFMRSFFNVRLNTVMNITDVDDKILEQTRKEFNLVHNNETPTTTEPTKHPFNELSDRYYRSFLKDLNTINVQPADFHVKISKHVHLITEFIRRLEKTGHAYIATNGDVYFRVSSVKNYVGRTDDRKKSPDEKLDQRDFVLWKVSKPDEPIWKYQSSVSDKCIPGRPGWHVQCSAIASALFGKKLDFHFGGMDLIFPHHYNEEACCCAYHDLDTSKSLHVWSRHWLHSGHLVLKDTKMSKSIGNTIAIQSFIGRSSVNALRLLCVYSHYRSNLDYSEDLVEKIKSIDHKISAFVSFLADELKLTQDNIIVLEEERDREVDADLKNATLATIDEILDGLCDDFHLDRGLFSILNLSKIVYSRGTGKISAPDLLTIWNLLKDWCETCGLSYSHVNTNSSSLQNESPVDLLSEFRQTTRKWVLEEMKSRQNSEDKSSLLKLLKECDAVRAKMDELGFVVRDPISKPKTQSS